MPYVNTRLGRWFYEVAGPSDGQAPIVLLHGLFLDLAQWRFQWPVLTATRRVYALEMPGHGRSDVAEPYTLEEQADALAQALEVLGLRGAVVVGLSWGGMLAMHLALRHPEWVSALGLLSTTAEAEPLRLRVLARAAIPVVARVGVPPWVFDRRIAPLMYGARIRRTQPEIVALAKARLLRMAPRAVARSLRTVACDRTGVLARLHAVRVSTLVLCGDADPLTPLGCSRRIAAAIAGAELVVVPDTGHLTAEEAPEIVNQALLEWLGRSVVR